MASSQSAPQPSLKRRRSSVPETPQPSKRHRNCVLSMTPQPSKQLREVANSTSPLEPLSSSPPEPSLSDPFTLPMPKKKAYYLPFRLTNAQPRDPLPSESSLDISTLYSDEEKAAKKKIRVLKKENHELKAMVGAITTHF